MSIEYIIWLYIYAVTIGIIVLTIYGMAKRPNLAKKLILLSIFSDTGNLLAVLIGMRSGMVKPPVFPGVSFTEHPSVNTTRLEEFANKAVDPIPQVLVITAIVIGLAVLVFLGYVAILLYQKYGTLDVRILEERIRESRGE